MARQPHVSPVAGLVTRQSRVGRGYPGGHRGSWRRSSSFLFLRERPSVSCRSVFVWVVVLTAVQFYAQPCVGAIEVQGIRRSWMLASEFEVADLPVTEQWPEQVLGVGRFFAEDEGTPSPRRERVFLRRLCAEASTRLRMGAASPHVIRHHRRHHRHRRLPVRLAASALPWRCESTSG